MATAKSVKGKIQGLISQANGVTGKTDADLTTAIGSLIAGFGQGGGPGGDLEVTEGTITPATESQVMRIPWQKDTLPLFYIVVRQDFDTYVTPDNPATEPVIGGVVAFTSGYIRTSASRTDRYLAMRLTATIGYTGYTPGVSSLADGILDSNGLLINSNSSAYGWMTDTTYKYYIIDKVVQ